MKMGLMGHKGRMGQTGANMKKLAIWMAAGMLGAGASWGGTAAEEAVPRAIVYQGVLSDPVEGALTGAQTVFS